MIFVVLQIYPWKRCTWNADIRKCFQIAKDREMVEQKWAWLLLISWWIQCQGLFITSTYRNCLHYPTEKLVSVT